MIPRWLSDLSLSLREVSGPRKDESIIAPSLQGELMSIPELLIEPTFWPVPDDEARAAQELTEVTIEPIDAIAGLRRPA